MPGNDGFSILYFEVIKKSPWHPFGQGLLWGLVVLGKRLVKPLIKETYLTVLISTIFVRLYKI